MDSRVSLYRVSVSSSGLIFAVIVGAWAAYLVPMWLRRQDELNEARPTERFSTALRLLTRGRRAASGTAEGDASTDDGPPAADAPGAADVRAFAEPVTTARPAPKAKAADTPAVPAATSARAKVLARRRRTTMVLFLAFTLGGMFALSAGSGFLWLPVVPAVLLLAYVVHVRRQERRRYAVALDRRRAEEAARRLRERTQASAAARPEPEPEKPARAVVEQTDHAEWVDQQRRRGGAAPEDEPETWDPAPVPLPTYVNAPVAPRTTRGVDLDAPDTWSAARSTTAGTPQPRSPEPRPEPGAPHRTPLFDQYADDDQRRRAAGE
jgi:type II secretory pathway pseudopilin PulG